MPRREARCAATGLPGDGGACPLVFGWATLDFGSDPAIDPTGVNPDALRPLRAAGWECVLGAWFCPLHKAAAAALVVARIKKRAAVPVGGGE